MRRLWVITECYPRPCAPSHCAFAHRQMVGVREAGWRVETLVPNGWFPPILRRVAPAWREARRAHVPRGWSIDGIRVSDLTYQNRVPSRLSRPRAHAQRVRAGLAHRLERGEARREQDLLLAQFALPYGGVVREVARELELRYAVQLRGDDVWVWPHASADARRTFTDALGDASLVLAVSRSLIDEARRLCGGALPPSVVVPNGIDLDLFRPGSPTERERARMRAGIAPHETAVLCVGDALVRKGWRELLEATERVATAARSPIVVIAATGTRVRELELDGEAARLAPSVRFVSFEQLPVAELAELYRAADVFCLASHWEGMANALLEAMASGLPVIVTSVAGHPEAVTDGVDGLLVEPKRVDELSSALQRLIDSKELRASLGRAARERAEAIGDSSGAGRRLSSALAGALEGRVPDSLQESNPYAPSDGRSVVSPRAG